jgi:hypothetical protein
MVAREQEVEQCPQLVHVVLQRGARQEQRRFVLEFAERRRDLNVHLTNVSTRPPY